MGREGALSAPQAKVWPPRTIFLAPALAHTLPELDLRQNFQWKGRTG